MTPVEKCLQMLGALIDEGNPNAIASAEQAIEEFLATATNVEGQMGALNDLCDKLLSMSRTKYGRSWNFATVLLESLAAHRRALRDTK